ncbi:hypothetical protein LJR290_007522 [Variovorax sp. LjRoot290]|uniref:hypothetical protein n=1 Tax=Variovorax sp. LjRoot290 TaxID=3342316 RepID=UPI003ECD9488
MSEMKNAASRRTITVRPSTPAEIASRDQVFALKARARVYLFGAMTGMPTSRRPAENTGDPLETIYSQACSLIDDIHATRATSSYEARKATILAVDRRYYKPGTEDDTWAAVDAAFA